MSDYKYSCVLFDLDGTLLNTNKLIIESFQHTLERHLGKNVEESELYQYFGEPLRDTLARFDSEQVEALLSTYRQHNMENHDRLVTLFPKVVETMSELDKHGVKMGIVTSKLKKGALKGIELHGLDNYIKALVTYDDTEEHKPSAMPILKAIEQLGISDWDKRNIIMVGDSLYDLRSANNAQVDSAVVSWSVHPLSKLLQENPKYVLNSIDEILPLCM